MPQDAYKVGSTIEIENPREPGEWLKAEVTYCGSDLLSCKLLSEPFEVLHIRRSPRHERAARAPGGVTVH